MNDVNLVLQHLEENNVFLTGGAGVGKSYTTNEIIRLYKENQSDEQIIALGSTGVSAVHIGGFTIHSFFVFGISSNFDELSQQDRRSRSRLLELKKILRATDLIIIDEISMVSASMMEMIHYRLSSMGYRGKVLFVGDFFQLPPVKKFGKQKDLFDDRVYAFESDAWQSFSPVVIELTEMKRTSDVEFTNILHKIRVGECDKEVEEYMFRLLKNNLSNKNPTYLFGRNAEVNATNRAKLNAIDAQEHLLLATFQEHYGKVHEKRLATWKKVLPIEEALTLKVGVPVLFTVNKWGKYANGERGVIHRIEEEYIIVEKEGNIFVRVERYDFDLLEMKSDEKGKVELVKLATISQFPIKLAYAITIHKSQGMSIDNLVCNVDNIFAPSQFYVAISRATNPKNLRIDFGRGDFTRYLHGIIRVDMKVIEYYNQLEKVPHTIEKKKEEPFSVIFDENSISISIPDINI